MPDLFDIFCTIQIQWNKKELKGQKIIFKNIYKTNYHTMKLLYKNNIKK
jgi:hypothetical protein